MRYIFVHMAFWGSYYQVCLISVNISIPHLLSPSFSLMTPSCKFTEKRDKFPFFSR